MLLNNHLLILATTAIMLSACTTPPCKTASWMHDQRQAITTHKLQQVIIPGSHLANAYNISNQATLQVCTGETLVASQTNNARLAKLVATHPTSYTNFINYLTTQQGNISAQLSSGIRYLKLRICLQNATYYTSNYYLTDSLDIIITQIKDFIKHNSDEIILIDLDDNLLAEYGAMTATDLNNLHNYLQLEFGAYLTPHSNWQELTFKKLWASKQRIILLSSNPILTQYADVWDKNEIVKTQGEAAFSTIKKLTLMQTQLVETELNPSNPDSLLLLPIYSWFNPELNHLSELNNINNDHLVVEYLHTIPTSIPLNIIVSERQTSRFLIDFAIQRNATSAK